LTPELERSIASIFGRKVNVEPIASIKREERKVIEENDDMDPDFYTHEHYNADNLYKNRANRQKKPKLQDSEFDNGLRLWEKRNENETIDTSDLTEEERMKLLKYRRELYRERRYKNESV